MRKWSTLTICLSLSALTLHAKNIDHRDTSEVSAGETGRKSFVGSLISGVFSGEKKEEKAEIGTEVFRPVATHELKSPKLITLKHKPSYRPVLDTDIIPVPVVNEDYLGSYQNMVYKRRLDSIQKIVPLSYNEYVQSYIDVYTAPRRKGQMGRMLGLSRYYFPIYEKAFREAGVPEEMKYLSIVESSLNPEAVSRVGATGLWQFMYATAKVYGLNMNNYVDERKDPIQASYAAAAYLKDAYDEFGDWLLAIAAYNCGKGNVWRAIDKTGSYNFWDIRRYLPSETRGYVPAFIAVAYAMNYPENHDIEFRESEFAINTDTIMVDKFIQLKTIADVLELSPEAIGRYNPSYKKQVINGTPEEPRRLIVPQIDRMHYGALYAALNNSENTMEPQAVFASNDDSYPNRRKGAVATGNTAYHKVRPGENLSVIASKYGVEVQDIKAWNRLRGSQVIVGQRLLVASSGKGRYEAPARAAAVKASFATYKVKPGDTLSDIAEKFEGTTVKELKADNGLKSSKLQAGTILKIKRG
ncbi:MAG: transglycosylase SLT domain-containing protein [Mucilaginibacter polytrichastri]|nr:transglycosylase SLT domain-containing protein [Mucilaginibacter polytrichastri]